MSDFGIIRGVFADRKIKISEVVAEAKTSEEAQLKAKIMPGSELIYKQDETWKLRQVTEEGMLWGENPLSAESKVELDASLVTSQGISKAAFSFVEQDLSLKQKYHEAQNTGTAPDMLAALAEDKTEVDHLYSLSRTQMSKSIVAANPSAPPEVLAKLAENHHDGEVMKALAKNPNTPVEALGRIIKNCPEKINNKLEYLLQRQDLPGELVAETLKIEPWISLDALKLRCLAVMHPNASPELLRQLTQDPHPSISSQARQRLEHPHALTEQLNQLAQDPDLLIRNLARGRLADTLTRNHAQQRLDTE